MKLISVQSSNVAAIGYSSETRELQVQFRNGGTYSHFNVPPEAHSALMAAESHGRFYNENIKGTYPSRPTADVVRPSEGTSGHPEVPQGTKSTEPVDAPLTLDGLIARLGLPSDTVLRGVVQSMMTQMPVEQIIERYGVRR